VRVFFLRDVVQFFEQRQIDVGLDVALRAGITVPVPRAAEVAAFFDDADVFHTGFTQTRRRQQPAKAAADDDHFHFVEQRRARKTGFDIGVVEVVREVAFDLLVLIVAIGAQALVALLPILFAQRVGIESKRFVVCGSGGVLIDQRHDDLSPKGSVDTRRAAAKQQSARFDMRRVWRKSLRAVGVARTRSQRTACHRSVNLLGDASRPAPPARGFFWPDSVQPALSRPLCSVSADPVFLFDARYCDGVRPVQRRNERAKLD
jgi:hypothetical protein